MAKAKPYAGMDDVLEALRKAQGAPFLNIAAQKCGVAWQTAHGWALRGREHMAEGKDSLESAFAAAVAEIQAKWKDEAMHKIATADRENSESARNLRWLLERLDRDTFDITRPAQAPRKGQGEKPGKIPKESVDKAAEDLAKPDLLS